MENFTWGPNDDRCHFAPFVAWCNPFVLFSGMVAAVGVVLWVVVVEGPHLDIFEITWPGKSASVQLHIEITFSPPKTFNKMILKTHQKAVA